VNCQNPLYRPQDHIRVEDGSVPLGAANRDLWLPMPLKRCDFGLEIGKDLSVRGIRMRRIAAAIAATLLPVAAVLSPTFRLLQPTTTTARN
jgi:hypothetical protein